MMIATALVVVGALLLAYGAFRGDWGIAGAGTALALGGVIVLVPRRAA